MAISRNTLPQEFYDITSSMMLKQPEPQYFFAQMLFGGSAQAELAQNAGPFGLSGRQVGANGASVPGLDQMQLVLSNIPEAEAIMVSLDLAGTGVPGNTVKINRPVFAGGSYTIEARAINPAVDISTVPVDVSSEQVILTLKPVSGPYDTVNGRVAPYAISALDAQRSAHSLAGIVGLQLTRDRMKFLDTVLANLYSAGSTTVYPNDPNNALSGVDAAFATAGDKPLDVETIYRAEEALNNLGIPRFSDGTYKAVFHPRQVRQLKSDPEFRGLVVFDPEKNPLRASLVGRVGNISVYQSATVASATNASSVTYYKGSVFGPQAVGYAPGQPCSVIASTADNYGLAPKVVWIAYEAFEKLDQRFICGVYTD